MIIQFEKYHAENPEIWNQFVKYAKMMKDRGFKHYSANGIFEILRFHTNTTGNDQFKINNIYRPDYARKLMAEDDNFKDFFHVREIKAKRV